MHNLFADYESVDFATHIMKYITNKRVIKTNNRLEIGSYLDFLVTLENECINAFHIKTPLTEQEEHLYELDQVLKLIKKTINKEKYKVMEEYLEHMPEYYITVKEVCNMLGVNVQYVTKNMMHDLKSLELHTLIRQHIKEIHIEMKIYKRKSGDAFVNFIDDNNIDYTKKIFISEKSLRKWIHEHLFLEDGTPINKNMIDIIIKNRKSPFLMNSCAYKELKGMDFDMQFYRSPIHKLRLYNEPGTKPLVRVTCSAEFQDEINLIKKEQA